MLTMIAIPPAPYWTWVLSSQLPMPRILWQVTVPRSTSGNGVTVGSASEKKALVGSILPTLRSAIEVGYGRSDFSCP